MSAKHHRPTGSGQAPVRSVRVTDEVWEAARRRAAYEGVTMSHVVNQIVEGYSRGLIDMPKVVVTYVPPRTEETMTK